MSSYVPEITPRHHMHMSSFRGRDFLRTIVRCRNAAVLYSERACREQSGRVISQRDNLGKKAWRVMVQVEAMRWRQVDFHVGYRNVFFPSYCHGASLHPKNPLIFYIPKKGCCRVSIRRFDSPSARFHKTFESSFLPRFQIWTLIVHLY